MQAPPQNMDTYNIKIKIGFLEISGRQNIGVYSSSSVGYFFVLYSVYIRWKRFIKADIFYIDCLTKFRLEEVMLNVGIGLLNYT